MKKYCPNNIISHIDSKGNILSNEDHQQGVAQRAEAFAVGINMDSDNIYIAHSENSSGVKQAHPDFSVADLHRPA